MIVKQGDIYLANLNPVKGHEQKGFRPVLVIQKSNLSDILNTVVIIPISSNLKAKGLMMTMFIQKKESGLPKDSVALAFQIRTVDKKRLKKKVGGICERRVREVKKQIGLLM